MYQGNQLGLNVSTKKMLIWYCRDERLHGEILLRRMSRTNGALLAALEERPTACACWTVHRVILYLSRAITVLSLEFYAAKTHS